jgi:phosphatidylglycerophosphate synthase
VTTRAVIVVSQAVAAQRFCGRTLIERHTIHLHSAGVSDVRVVDAAELPRQWTSADAGESVLFVTAERIFDPRLYAAILKGERPVRLTERNEPVGMELRRGDDRAIDALAIESLDPYSRELRRSLRPYWLQISSADDRAAATRLLVEASGKGHQDLPAMLINAPLEQAAMRRLANTAITPNQITAICNLLAYIVAALLASGSLLTGALGAIVVGVIDGLDGRQARVQLRTSRLGRLEHLLDKVYEVLWIVAIAYTLSSAFADRRYVALLSLWIVAYLLDSVAYDLVKWRTGVTLDETSRLDAVIRLVAGRRNVYACMLLVGVVAGVPAIAFHVIVWWAVATAVVHLLRAGMVVLSARSRVLV